MLKAMRKNVKSLAPTLWIVIAAFVIAIFAVWGGAGRLGEGERANVVATIGKQKISSEQYLQALQARLQSLKTEFKELNRSFIEQLNIPQQVLEQIIQQALLSQLARDLGLSASGEEIREKIISYPVFQKDGKFIGFEKYKDILDWNRISMVEFEDNLRNEIILNKVVQLLTAGIVVSEEEMWESYKNTKETAKVEYLVLEKTKVELAAKPTAEDIRAYFEKNKDRYKIPERREASLVFLKVEDLKKEIELSESEIKKYYEDNIDQFKTPEETKVSRIFIPYESRERPLVRNDAQGLLDRLTRGEDFAALARNHSKDAKAKDGGDWGLYEWKSLAAREQEEIQKLNQGQVSGVIELEDGVSILKVTEKKPAVTSPFEEVRTRIKSQLQDQRARELANERITRLEKAARKEKSLEQAAKKNNFPTTKTGLLKKGEALGDYDPSGAISQALFELKEKDISSPIFTYIGSGVAQLEKIEAQRPATYEEVEQDVEKDVTEVKKKEKALEKIQEVKSKITAKNWEDIASQNGLEFKTIDEHKRGQYVGGIGESPEFDQQAFTLPLNQAGDHLEFENGYALLRVLERKEVSRADFEKDRESEKNTLLDTKRNKFLFSYLAKLREEKDVKVRYDLFLKLNSDLLSRYEGSE